METYLHRNLVLREMILVEEPPPPELLAAYKAKDEDLERAWVEHSEGLDLKGRDLRRADLRDSKLYRADFRGANLTLARLTLANLSNARFDLYEHEDRTETATLLIRTDLSYANLHGADLRNAELQSAILEEAELHGANLDLATLDGAFLNGARFVACRMRGASIGGADFSGASVKLCDLRGASDEVLDKDSWTKLMERLERELEDVPEALRNVRRLLDDAAVRETTFPLAAKHISHCLVLDDSKWAEFHWRAEDVQQFERSLADHWVKLACDDSRVAKAMVLRAVYYEFLSMPRHPWARLADGLMKGYNKALAGEEACDGLKQLDKTTISRLRKIVEESQSRDRNGN